jgi:hypothetical protein
VSTPRAAFRRERQLVADALTRAMEAREPGTRWLVPVYDDATLPTLDELARFGRTA